MNMRSLQSCLDTARQAGPSDRLFLAAEAGEALEQALADSKNLTFISRRMADVAKRTHSTRVFGASPLGERIAAATVVTAQNGLSDQKAGLEGERVLVVDGLLVTGIQVANALRRANAAGAASVSIAVVASLENAAPAAAGNGLTVLLS